MTEQEITERTFQAVEYFKEGYNCAQAVVMAYADRYDADVEALKQISGPFGGGMGRLREVCGAATGMFMILGLEHPTNDPTNKIAKTENYAAVQRTALAFKEKLGSYICADLLKIGREPQSVTPDDRNFEYYSKRPCALCVAVGASILGKELK
ncbi:MAG TPA: C-GCAxxG-C-C family protein [Bacteroidales bacterium]|nr:C-GCAxxG-C-C family protein [Bacteroidales bacterium]